MANIVLASGSPRRQELLGRMGIHDFVVCVPQVDEVCPEGLTPEETEERAALRQEYLNSIMGNLRRELDNTWIVDEQGNKRKLTPGKKEMS